MLTKQPIHHRTLSGGHLCLGLCLIHQCSH
jgi:hypothetical protein